MIRLVNYCQFVYIVYKSKHYYIVISMTRSHLLGKTQRRSSLNLRG